jgi:hypothetical protein
MEQMTAREIVFNDGRSFEAVFRVELLHRGDPIGEITIKTAKNVIFVEETKCTETRVRFVRNNAPQLLDPFDMSYCIAGDFG